MRIDKWKGYEKYLVMADRSNNKVSPNYGAYCEFRRVVKALEKIASTHNDQWYDFEDNRYKKIVTNAQAESALYDLRNANYNKSILNVAKQIGAIIKE